MPWGKPVENMKTKRGNVHLNHLDKAGMKRITIRIDEIATDEHQREVNESHVKKLMKQIKRIGLVDPIRVRNVDGRHFLVEGGHRLEAHKRLGAKEIRAFLFEGTKFEELLVQWTADDNLKHTAMHRAERLVRLVHEWIVEHKEDDPEPRKQGRPKGDIAKAARSLPLGGSPAGRLKRVQRAFKIAELPDDVKARAVELGLDANQAALESAAHEESKGAMLAQLEKRARLLKGQKAQREKFKKKLNDRRALREKKGLEDYNDEDIFEALKLACSKRFRDLWAKADAAVRERFLSQVLKWKGVDPSATDDWDC
jgi:sulfiredoxin